MEGVEHFLHSILSIVSFTLVVILTVALVTKLKKSSEWRKESTAQTAQLNNVCIREQKTVKMVVLIATVLIVCYTPGTMLTLATFVLGPDLNVLGKYVNICLASWSVGYVCQAINSSVNIILYYKMSSKYRRTFDELLSLCKQSCKKLSSKSIKATGIDGYNSKL